MRVLFVACLFVTDIYFVVAKQNVNANESEVIHPTDIKLNNRGILLNQNTREAQRRGDTGFYYNNIDRYTFGNHRDCSRSGYPGRIINRQPNRPFKHYGPPHQENPSFNHEPAKLMPSESLLNQDMPSLIRDNQFAMESPIASQNNQPFGQHTANYLPPRNQKLPASNPPHLFSINPQGFLRGNQQQDQQVQLDNQNSLRPNFDAANPNVVQNDYQNHQISDAAIFLSQNAQAISNLYGAPAANENYAPHNQQFEEIDQNQQPNQDNSQKPNLQDSFVRPSVGFREPLPSYASGILNAQDSLEKIQSLEKDRIIAQLQQALTNRESVARNVQNFNYLQSQNTQVPTLQSPSINKPLINQQTVFSPISALSSSGYQGFYTPSTPVTTALPTISSPAPTATTIHPLSQGSSGPDSAQTGITLSVSGGLKPTIMNPGFPQHTGFVPTFGSSGFIPSSPTYATTLTSTSPSKPVDNSPTHFGIPIPTLQGQNTLMHQAPFHPPSTTPATMKPSNILTSNPNTPTFSIPLGSVSTFLQPSVIKPQPTPVIPAASSVHPIFGIYPTVVNPNFAYKPVKVFPVYYPNVSYQSIHKPVVSASIYPLSYATSFAQTKQSQIWK